ncbi:MAG: sigma 54-interacting transcriptional regulator [Gemmatimonadota bacterium]|nr:sigma 54-interacting transcriptional regulator [Gemmatimonadota bacterium]
MIKPLERTGTYRTYSIADGLAGMRIEHIAEDREGCIWFATWDNGVSRFDGNEFQNFTKQDGLIDDRTYFVTQDSQNRLWFGTANGVCWYDGARFHHLKDDGIADRDVRCIYEDNEGRVWLGGTRTIGYWDSTAFHDMIPLYLQHYEEPPSSKSRPCWGITQDPQGQMWFGFNYLIRFDGESFHRYDEKDGFPQDGTAYAVDTDHTGKVWIGRFGNRDGLWCYANGTFQSVQVDLGGWIRKIQCDREGRMWFCTSEGGLYQDGNGFSKFTIADGLPHPAVKAVFQDRDHQYWFATWGGGGLYDAHSISVFDLGKASPKDKKPVEISQIVQDRQGDIWIGRVSPILTSLNKSVARFDGEHFAFVGAEQDFDIDNCFSIYEDHEGYLWFGGLNGLFRYDGQEFKKMKIAAVSGDRSISAITQDLQGQFLFGYWEKYTYKTEFIKEALSVSPLKIIYQRDEQFQTIFVEEDKKDALDRIGTVIAGRNGEVYFHLASHNFSVGGRGLARWHPEDGLKFYGIEDGLIDDRVTDLIEDRHGNLWIATLGGLCRFDGSTFQTFTTDDGLPSNRIRCVFEDRQGHLWLGTDRGVTHYNGQLFQTINSPHIGPVCRILEDRDGTFYFGTLMGSIIRYRLRQTLPRIRLLQVIADQVYENSEEAIVSTAGQQVIFEYKGLSFSTDPNDMLYVYRLNGYDADWQLATRKMRAFYRDLPPGDYTFQVRAIDRDLNYSEIAQTRLSITADPRIEALTDVINRRESQKFIGHSAALRQFQSNLEKIASTNMTVLIMGETGVGKGLAARTLHALSAHSEGPFIEVSCGALPGTLVDSELFGHEKGAFTGAVFHRLGRVELAEGGTLFLDEIGDMAVETQSKLLRLLEEGRFERIGSSETRMAKTRIVAATNRNLEEMVNAGDFREDLYYRLNAFPMYLPPLRERKEDILELAEYFKTRMATHLGKQIESLTPEVIEMLQSYDWPGNVRELEHTINRAVIICHGSQIKEDDLGMNYSQITGSTPRRSTLSASQEREVVPLDEFERRYILGVLEATNYQIKGAMGAATLLGLPPSTLYNKMKRLGIKPNHR